MTFQGKVWKNVSTCVYISTAAKRNLRLPIRLPRLAGIRNPDVLSETAPEKSVINSYLNGKETEYERYLFQCEMLGETVDLERIREILTGKARTAPSEKTNATLDEIFDAYVDKLRTDNRRERTVIGILDLKKDMAKFSKRSKKRTIDQLDILS